MDIRQLKYLVALAREKHFTRAAEACGVTQPTLSGRLRQLEQDLGVPIVERGQRFHGLTPEGERVLAWAQRILADCDGLEDELARLRGGAGGALTLGVIPSALPVTPPLTDLVRKAFPEVHFTVLSQSSKEIARGLEEFSIDLGLTYLDNEPVEHCITRPLYRERYRLFVHIDDPLAARDSVTWAEASQRPLCLLTPNMQNRRIVDAAFRRAGVRPRAEVESNSAINLCAHVRLGGLAAVLPEFFIGMIAGGDAVRAVPLVEPEVEHSVGLAALDRDPLPRLVDATLKAAADYRLPEALVSRL